jgi:cadmium resistance protein CadD (predicted permease)
MRRSQPCFWNKCFFERVFGGGDHAVNGADNIGVYAPFFIASRSHLSWVLAVYALLVLVWRIVGKLLGSHALVLKSLDQWGHWVVPFVLIALGCFILLFPIRT